MKTSTEGNKLPDHFVCTPGCFRLRSGLGLLVVERGRADGGENANMGLRYAGLPLLPGTPHTLGRSARYSLIPSSAENLA